MLLNETVFAADVVHAASAALLRTILTAEPDPACACITGTPGAEDNVRPAL